MLEREFTTEVADAGEVLARWDELLDLFLEGDKRVVLTRDGKEVAAVISMADLQLYGRLWELRREEFKPLFETREAFKDVLDEELEREVANALAEVRAEMQAELLDRERRLADTA